jgi:hypothetical protein
VEREHALDDLPKPFFDKSFDPVERLLKQMPIPAAVDPHKLPAPLPGDGRTEDGGRESAAGRASSALATREDRERAIGEWCYNETTRADLARDAVQGRLSRAIMDNYAAFVEGMQLIQGVEASIERALGLAGIAGRRLSSCRQDMVVAGLDMICVRRRRSRLAGLRSLLRKSGRLSRVEAVVTRLCDAGHLVGAVRAALHARDDLSAHEVAKLSALEQARDRVGSGAALLAVRLRVDASLGNAISAGVRELDEQASGLVTRAKLGVFASGSGVLTFEQEEQEAALLLLQRRQQHTGSAGRAQLRPGKWSLLRLCRTLAAVSRAYALLDAAGVEAWSPEAAAHAAEALASDQHQASAGAGGARRMGRARAASTLASVSSLVSGAESGISVPPAASPDGGTGESGGFELSQEAVSRALDMSSAEGGDSASAGKASKSAPLQSAAAKRIFDAAAAADDGSKATGTAPAQRLVDRLPDILADAARGAIKQLTKEALVDCMLGPMRREAVAALVRARQLAAAMPPPASDEEELEKEEDTDAERGVTRPPPPPLHLPPAVRQYLARRREALTTATFSELCQRLPPASLPAVATRVCAAITWVLYAHAACVQWSRKPLGAWVHGTATSDEEAHAILFARGMDEEDDSDATAHAAAEAADRIAAAAAVRDATEAMRAAVQAASGEATTANEDESEESPSKCPPLLERLSEEEEASLSGRLCALRPALLRSRAVVWQAAQQRAGEMLLEAASAAGAGSGGVSWLATAMAVCRDLARVGTEYAGSAAGSLGWSVLRDAAAVASARAADKALRDAASSLRSLLGRDAWRMVPIKRTALATVLSSVQQRTRQPFQHRLRQLQAASCLGGGSGLHAVALPMPLPVDTDAAAQDARAVSLLRGLASPTLTRLLRRRKGSRAAANALATGAPATVGESSVDDVSDALALPAAELDALGYLEERAGHALATWWALPSEAVTHGMASGTGHAAGVLPTLTGSLLGGSGQGNPFGCFSDGRLYDEVAVAEATATAAEAAFVALRGMTSKQQSGSAPGVSGSRARGRGRSRGASSGMHGRGASSFSITDLVDPVALEAARQAAIAAVSSDAVGLAVAIRVRAEAVDDGAIVSGLTRDASDTAAAAVAVGSAPPLFGARHGPTGGLGSLEADMGRTMSGLGTRMLQCLVTAATVPLGEAGSEAATLAAAAAAAAAAAEEEEDDADEDEEEGRDEDDDDDHGRRAGAGRGSDDDDSEEELAAGSQAAEERADRQERARKDAAARVVRRRVAQPVLTAAALSGVARAAGRFAEAMEALPGSAPDALRALGRLFDSYLYAVATAFLPKAALRAVCASPEAFAQAVAAAEADPRAAADASVAANGGMGSSGGVSAPTAGSDRRRRGGGAPKQALASLLPEAHAAVETAFRSAVIAARAREEAADLRRAKRLQAITGTGTGTAAAGAAALTGARSPSRRLMRAASSSAMRHRVASAADILNGISAGTEGSFSAFLAGHTRLDHRRGALAMATVEGAAASASATGAPDGKDASAAAAAASSSSSSAGLPVSHRHPFATLRCELRRIAQDMCGPSWAEASAADASAAANAGKSAEAACAVPPASLRVSEDLVEMRSPPTAPGLASRCVAVESVTFCLQVLFMAAPRVSAALPASHRPLLTALLVRAVSAANQLRAALFAAAAGGLGLGLRRVSERMAAVRWSGLGMAGAAESEHVADAAAVLGAAGTTLRKLVEGDAAGGSAQMPESARIAIWGTLEARVWSEAVYGFAAAPNKDLSALGQLKKDIFDLQEQLRRHGPAGLGEVVAYGASSLGAPTGAGASSSSSAGGDDDDKTLVTPPGLPQVSSRDSNHLVEIAFAMVPDSADELVTWAVEHSQQYTRKQLRALVESGFHSGSRSRADSHALLDRLNKALDEADAT